MSFESASTHFAVSFVVLPVSVWKHIGHYTCHHAYGSLPPLHSNTSKGDCTQDYSFLMYKQYSKQSLGTYELLVVLHAEGDTCGNDATIHELQKKLKGTPANSKMEVPYPVIMHHCVQCSSCIKSHACSS